MKNMNHVPYGLFMVLGEFLIIVSAVLVGYIIEHPENIFYFILYLIFIPILLILAVILKYFAEKCKKDEELIFSRILKKP